MQGVGLPPVRLHAGYRPGPERIRGERRDGVFAEVEGPAAAVTEFVGALRRDAPPLARIERVATAVGAAARVVPSFAIVASGPAGTARILVSADMRHLRRLPGRAVRSGRPPLSLSVPQLHQLRPAATIVRGIALRPARDDDGVVRHVPRDAAPSTTTRPIAASTPSRPPARPAGRGCGWMRRGHAGPGRRPRIGTAGRGGCGTGDRRGQRTGRLSPGCDAADDAAVAALRARKHREEKPFAVMAADLAAARRIAAGRRRRSGTLLTDPRPADRAAARRRAPARRRWRRREIRWLGVMLPYTPLHHLLLRGDRRHPAGDDQRQSLR